MTRTYKISDEKRAENAARMKALNADPEFAAKNAAASRERMKALNADPEFNPLVGLSDRQRRIYDTLKRKGCSFDEAFREAQKEKVA